MNEGVATLHERRIYELTTWQVPGPFEKIPSLLYHRADLPGPKPAIVYYHGVVQSKETYVDSHGTARRLADAGFVVAIPDAPGHGQRDLGASLVPRLRESLPREFCADIEQAADESADLLDWLAARPEVDARRLGVAGVSMGGFTAAVVAARARERLRAAVCVAGCADLTQCMATTDSIAPGKWGPSDRAIDEETRDRIARIDPLNYPERFAPLPLLLLHGDRDTWNPCETSERFAAAVAPAYASCPDDFRCTIVPGAVHWPPSPAIVGAAVAWFTQHVAAAT
ncbi:MAG TPA: alpha/beta fold hydrolase [Chloroflexota bacterium]|nr:alpha/beta fold hydrolase [Chloroflexota bacterium]